MDNEGNVENDQIGKAVDRAIKYGFNEGLLYALTRIFSNSKKGDGLYRMVMKGTYKEIVEGMTKEDYEEMVMHAHKTNAIESSGLSWYHHIKGDKNG